MTHANNCILSSRCKLANGPTCNRTCSAYISMHGYSGTGGRVANAGTPADYRLLQTSPAVARSETGRAFSGDGTIAHIRVWVKGHRSSSGRGDRRPRRPWAAWPVAVVPPAEKQAGRAGSRRRIFVA